MTESARAFKIKQKRLSISNGAQIPGFFEQKTLMQSSSNAAGAYEPDFDEAKYDIPVNLLPPASLTQPLWKSLLGGLRHMVAPEKMPPLLLTSRPVNVGLLLGDQLSLPWFRTIFTNLGDVISPETLPPLELESTPVDVGELITDQLSHMWWSSLLRNLADRVVPERLPALELQAKPAHDILPQSWLLLPLWSEVISTPKVFYPDKPAPERVPQPPLPRPAVVTAEAPVETSADPAPRDLLREIRYSRFRLRVWIGVAVAQVTYLILMTFWPGLLRW